MARREYKGAATPTTITSSITNSATTVTVADATNWPTGSFSFVIDPGLAGEAKILATSRSGTIVTITTRGYDNTSASAHTSGAVTYPVPTAIDFDEANNLVNTIGTLGTGVATFLQTPSSANLATAVTDETGSGSLVFATLPTFGATGIKLTGSTSGTTTIVSGATAGTSSLTLPVATDTLVGKATTDTFTNKTLTTPVITQGTSTPSFTTNAYTVVAGDAGQFLLASNSTTAGTINIPTDATYAFPNGTQIHIQQTGTGQITVQATTSGTTTVTSNGASAAAPKIRAQYSVCTLQKNSTNNWTVYGDIA